MSHRVDALLSDDLTAADYRRLVGEPLTTASRVLTERIGAELVTVPGFYPRVQQPRQVNAALAALWDRAA